MQWKNLITLEWYSSKIKSIKAMDGKDDADLLIPTTPIEHVKFSSATVSIIWEEIKNKIQSLFLRNFWFGSNETTLLLKDFKPVFLIKLLSLLMHVDLALQFCQRTYFIWSSAKTFHHCKRNRNMYKKQ